MRKVKFTQQSFHDRLSQIIQEFPKLDVSSICFASIRLLLALPISLY